MACKCDPARKRDTECPCKHAPPLPAGSPRRALNPKVCPQGLKCGTGIPEPIPPSATETSEARRCSRNIPQVWEEEPSRLDEDSFRSCVSLEPPRRAPCARAVSQTPPKPTCPASAAETPPKLPPCTKATERKEKKPLKRKRKSAKDGCRGSAAAFLPCGGIPDDDDPRAAGRFNRISALEKTVSRTEWYDEEGYHTASVSLSHLYHPDDQEEGRPCSSEKRHNYLRAKLKKLLAKTHLIPESVLPGNVEARPEPEVVAAALFMLEKEGADLGTARPDNIFNKLFSQSSPERSIAIVSAATETTNNTVVPVIAEGEQSNTLIDVPDANRIMENTRSVVAPNPNVFQQSQLQETKNKTNKQNKRERAEGATDENLLEYVINANPPAYRNCLRLNGSSKPCWFPGYSFACSEFVRTTSDPSEALYEGWHLCRPQHFHESEKFVVNAE